MATKKTKRKTTAKKTPKKKAPAKKVAAMKGANGRQPPEPKTSAAAKPESKPTRKAAPPKNPKPARTRKRDPRLPDPGTVIQKRDRHGNIRCECTVEDGNVRYNGKHYRSLSAAAMAAAKHLGLDARAQNGFTFWGLSKPPRKGVDPLVSLEKAWQRYSDRLAATLKNGISDENRERVHALVEQHSEAMLALREGAR